MMPLTFPYSIFKARAVSLDIVGQVISGGVTQSGQQQVVNATGGGLWALRMDFQTLRTPDQIRAWRAIQYGSDGGVKAINVTLCEVRYAPGAVPGYGVPHDDGTPFSDGSLYSSTLSSAQLVADAALRATMVVIDFGEDAEPLGGEYFSMRYGEDEWHELHVIISAVSVGDYYECEIRPPLRAAHAAGDEMDFGHPTITVRLAQQDAMSMQLNFGRRADVSAAFIEALV